MLLEIHNRLYNIIAENNTAFNRVIYPLGRQLTLATSSVFYIFNYRVNEPHYFFY